MGCMDDEKQATREKPFTREDFLRDLRRVVDAKRPCDEKEKRPVQSASKKP